MLEYSNSHNLDFWQNYCGHPELSVEEALDEVDLGHAINLPFNYLSAGQKRRAAIARLLVSDRPVWIMDEPTSSLDHTIENKLIAMSKEILKNKTLIVIAHRLSTIIESDTIIVMSFGTIEKIINKKETFSIKELEEYFE